MEYIKGINFSPFAPRGEFEKKKTFESIDTMIARTGCNMVILVPNGLQDDAHTEKIDYTGVATVSDEELINLIQYIKSKNKKVALKPTVNCKNGTWRAYISFFDIDVPCEAKWSNWFASYTAFQLHYAEIAQKYGCDMFIAGCEMVMSEHREAEWRKLIADIKAVFSGLVSYNTDKYQEDHVTWWDCVDVISSSGYYPIGQWDKELKRIEAVVKKYNKPFFFAEIGCMNSEPSKYLPNNWSLKGTLDLEGQVEWYKDMFLVTSKCDWIEGYGVWDWPAILKSVEKMSQQIDYNIYGKPVEKIVSQFYKAR